MKVTIKNHGDERVKVKVSVKGVDSGWVKLPPDTTLSANAQRTVSISINVPDGRSSKDYQLEIRLSGQDAESLR